MMLSANGRCERPGFARDYLPIACFLGLTFVVSSIPGRALPPLGAWNLDKLLHGAEFLVLGALLMRPLSRAGLGLRPRAQVMIAVGAASLWGALDELHQLITPNRVSDLHDWMADTIGALAGALVFLACARLVVARRRRAAPVVEVLP
jgi:VanZ family protein